VAEQRRAALATVTGLYALFAVLVPVDRGPAMCPFRMLTGRRCPLCGLTRASHALSRGDIRGMLESHPLAPLLWAAVAIGLWRGGDARARGDARGINRIDTNLGITHLTTHPTRLGGL
jgi:hypothetical protein